MTNKELQQENEDLKTEVETKKETIKNLEGLVFYEDVSEVASDRFNCSNKKEVRTKIYYRDDALLFKGKYQEATKTIAGLKETITLLINPVIEKVNIDECPNC